MKPFERENNVERDILLIDYARKEGFTESLALRPVAKSIYYQVLNDIKKVSSGDIINCIFAGIEMCDVSFADEFIINLQKLVMSVDNALLRIMDANDYVQENLEGALAIRNKKDRTKICLLIFSNNNYTILGDIEKNLKETFSVIIANYQITAREIAQKYDIEINSASNRLKKLFDLCLLQRKESIDEMGRQHLYYLPK